MRSVLAVTSVLFSAILVSAPASALDPRRPVRQYLLDSWDESVGLPQNNIKDIAQTADGYLWIATKSGLARFDGVRFVTYDDRRPGQLEEGEVWALAEAGGGALWLGTYGGGLTLMKDGRFTTYRTGDSGLVSDFVLDLAKDADGGLWIGTESGLCHLRDGRFTCYGARDGLPSANVRSLHVDKGGNLWIGTTGGLAGYHSGRFVNYATRFPGRLSSPVASIAGDSASGIWVGTTTAGVYRLRGDDLSHYGVRDGLPGPSVAALLIDGQGVLWVGTDDGLCRLRNERCEPYFTDFAGRSAAGMLETSSLRDIQALAYDREGSLWVGTVLDGLVRLRDGVFDHIRQAEGLPDDNARSICEEAGGGIWVGTATGAARFSGNTSTVFTPADGLLDASVLTVVPGPDGSVWIGTTRGLSRFRHGRIESMTFGGRIRAGIQAVVPDGQGALWIGTQSQGLYRYRDGSLVEYGEEQGLTGRQIRALVVDDKGRMWVGSKDGGLARYEGGRFVDIPLQDEPWKASVNALYVQDDGTLWVATRHGLKRVKDDRVATLTAQHGLASNFIYQFVDDSRGDLWMTFGRGIMRVALSELNAAAEGLAKRVACATYGSIDGLQSTYMAVGRQNAAYRSRDGRLWFASGRGVAIADPTSIPVNTLEPPTWVEEIVVDGRSRGLPTDPRFGPGGGQVDIRYTGLSFLAPDRVRFQHLLEGLDDRWVDAGTRRVAYYTNLPPGAYRFRVKACNKDGVCNETGATYSFTLLPHWYQTPLARSFGVLVAAFVLLAGHRLRVRQLRRREAGLEKRVEQRTGELQQEIENHRITEQKLYTEARQREQAQQELRQLNEELGERVTQRTQQLAAAYEDLSSEKERVTVTLRSIGEGVIATDTDGTVVLLNRVAEDLIGWPRDEAVAHHIGEVFQLVERWTRKPLPNPLAEVLHNEKAAESPGPVVLVSRTGDEKLIASSVAPIRDHQSRVTGAVVVFRDVTERVRIEEHLANVGKLESLGVLAAGIAHDFNNLLAGLFGYIDLARLQSPEGGAVRQRLLKALGVLNRARGLSGQLLTFTSGSAPVKTPTNVGNLVRDGARFALAGSNVTSNVSIPDDLWLCDLDPSQISQVVDNLLINARQAMLEGGRIDIRAENVSLKGDPILTDGRYVRLMIQDQGAGVATEHRDRVFDPFFTTKSGGTGLGLATSHSIVKKHGGHIEFDSIEGKGTTFRVMLPASEAGDAELAAPAERTRPVRGRILVMDDEAILREVVVAALEELELRVEAVADGSSALAACRSAKESGDPYDLIILDLTIAGGIGGVETLERIRTFQPSVLAIATSGYTSDGVMAEPARFGFQAALAKPFLIDEVHKAVALLLG